MENFTLEKRQLCDIQGRLFELALKAGADCPLFIESFMNSKTAAALDDVYDRLQWAGEEYIFEDNEVSEVKYVHFQELEKMVEERAEGLLIHEEEYKRLFDFIRENY